MNSSIHFPDQLVVHATTACLPTLPYAEVARILAAGVAQEPWGPLSLAHVQVCPQHPHVLTEELLDQIAAVLPGTVLRLHATVPVMRRHVFGSDAWWSKDSRPYWERVASLSRHIKAPAYTFHAGTREHHSFDEMLDQARRFEQLFECKVGIEGLYPDPVKKQSWFVDSWAEYRLLMDSGVCYAIDLSHLNILARVHNEIDMGLANDLVCHPNCIEIHVSDNDGMSDRHQMMRPQAEQMMWWIPLLARAVRQRPEALVFSESSRPWEERAGKPKSFVERHRATQTSVHLPSTTS